MLQIRKRRWLCIAAALAFTVVRSEAQQVTPAGPLADLVIAGYGSTTYGATLNDDLPNNFSASLSPILLYAMGDNLLFEAELEFGLSGELTTTTLEYAQVDWHGWENVQVVAGKFLVPFGLFGERSHPSWINKLPSAPVLFGHAHGGVADESLLPILSDAGAMLRANLGLGERSHFDLSLWVSQGPRLVSADEADDHGDAHPAVAQYAPGHGGGGSIGAFDIPRVGFGISFSDNNKNKMLGGRFGYVLAPTFELYVSGFHSMYDEDSFLDYQGAALSVEARPGGLEVKAEGAVTWQEFQHEGEYETLRTPAYFLQVSKLFTKWEPVVRWGQLLEGKVGDEPARASRDELAVGLNYWLDASVPLKLAWVIDPDADDRLLLQLGFGF